MNPHARKSLAWIASLRLAATMLIGEAGATVQITGTVVSLRPSRRLSIQRPTTAPSLIGDPQHHRHLRLRGGATTSHCVGVTS